MNFRERLGRLSQREYLPMLGSAAMWALVLTATGPADALLLLAALAMFRSVQLFTRVPTRTALRQRIRAPSKVRRQSAKRAWRIQFASLAAGLVILAVLVLGVGSAGQANWAALIALMSVGYPARNLLQAEPQANVRQFTILVQWLGAALIAPALVFGWGTFEIAFLIGLREWIAAAAALVWKHRTAEDAGKFREAPLTAAEIGAVTALRARRAFTYRLGKALLSMFLPGAALFARTARGLNLHHRLERRLPHYQPAFILVSLASLGAAFSIILWFPKPLSLVVAAMLVRLAAAGGAVVLWWPFLERVDYADVDDDEDY